MQNARLDEAQAGINNLRCADDTTLTAESEEELKSLLMKVKESEKAGLKFNIQKTKIMASGLITSWQIDGEKMETVTDFVFSHSHNALSTYNQSLIAQYIQNHSLNYLCTAITFIQTT